MHTMCQDGCEIADWLERSSSSRIVYPELLDEQQNGDQGQVVNGK